MIKIDFVSSIGAVPALALGIDANGCISEAGKPDFSARILAEQTLATPRFQGKNKGEGEVLTAFRPTGWLALLGLGENDDQTPSRLRKLGGALYQATAKMGEATLSVAMDFDPEQIAEMAYGARLRSWRISPDWRSRKNPEDRLTLKKIVFVTSDPEKSAACFERLEAVAQGMDFARDLIAAPGNALGPNDFAKRLLDLRKLGIEVEILDKKALKAKKLNLLLAVGCGSEKSPCLAIMQWKGGQSSDAPLLLVGKGITFDTGGISIKPALRMGEMKGDMGGAVAIAGTLVAAAERSAPVNIVGIAAIAENMPSGSAARPGDVVKSHAGLFVEIIDTDAEGRLALADALSYGAKTFKPKAIIDLATLTGSVVVALGTERAGLFCNNDRFAEQLLEIGEAENERLWRMPLTDYYDEALESGIADIRNCCWESPSPDSLHAARFLERFVPKDIPWAHLDIAGVSETDKETALSVKGPTGFGIKLLDRLVDQALRS